MLILLPWFRQSLLSWTGAWNPSQSLPSNSMGLHSSWPGFALQWDRGQVLSAFHSGIENGLAFLAQFTEA